MKVVESGWERVNRDKMDANLVGGNNHILDNVHLGGTDEHWSIEYSFLYQFSGGNNVNTHLVLVLDGKELV